VNRSDIDRADIAATDMAAIQSQLGRAPRNIVRVAHRCPCGHPDVVETAPRLSDGTPFPTFYYLTCPRAASLVGTLEAGGLMRDMTERLSHDDDLADRYRRAHESYLTARAAVGEVKEIADVSAGGMPDRVKCLHVLVAHSLAAGDAVNPLGDETLTRLPAWWTAGPCVQAKLAAERSAESGSERR